MSRNHVFLIVMAVLFCLLFVVQMNMPRSFVWYQTYSHLDRQPFGSYVFDSIMKETMPKGYQVTRQSFYQLDKLNENKKISVLLLADSRQLAKLDIIHLENIARRGGRVLVVISGILPGDSLDKDKYVFPHVNGTSFAYFSLDYLKRNIMSKDSMLFDTLYWERNDARYSACQFRTYRELLNGSVWVDSLPHRVLAHRLSGERYNQKEDSLYVGKHWYEQAYVDSGMKKCEFALKKIPAVVSVPCGKGEIIFSCNPLLFTNYGVLNRVTSSYVFRIMSQISDFPVYRTEAYLDKREQQGGYYSPFREFLKRPPLCWALYLAILGVVLFLVFSARRRQRIIPVMLKPENKSLEFVKLIGTLYFQRHDNRDLVEKKFRFFAETVRRKAGIDVSDVNQGTEDCMELARRTGLEYKKLLDTIRQIRLVVHMEENIPSKQMRHLIDEMNDILGRL